MGIKRRKISIKQAKLGDNKKQKTRYKIVTKKLRKKLHIKTERGI